MAYENDPTDEYLISELRNGQERAFDFIFRKYYKILCVQANIYVNDIDKAQSIAQDCFVKLWTNRTDDNQIKNLSAYLSVMLRNQCLDYIRRIKLEKSLHKKIEQEQIVDNTENIIISREFEERLLVVLSSLPERSRMAFEYSRFENLTYQEIAEKMNISSKAVEALMSRSLKSLRMGLKNYLPALSAFLRLI